MDNIKKSRIMSLFLKKIRGLDWQTHDGSTFSFKGEKITYNFSSYALRLDYNDSSDRKDTGHSFSVSNHPEIAKIYLELQSSSEEKALIEILNECPDIKREIGCEDILEQSDET